MAIIRKLEVTDYTRGFLENLKQLTTVGDISYIQFEERFKELNMNPDYYIFVAYEDERVVGSLTLLIEKKFIHSCGNVGHIEDVVCSESKRGKGIGKKLVYAALKKAEERNCYKVILDCSKENTGFYNKCGFEEKELQMKKILL